MSWSDVLVGVDFVVVTALVFVAWSINGLAVAIPPFVVSYAGVSCPPGRECSICQDSCEPRDWIKLACGHTFHDQCLSRWAATVTSGLTGLYTCPLCRKHFQVVWVCRIRDAVVGTLRLMHAASCVSYASCFYLLFVVARQAGVTAAACALVPVFIAQRAQRNGRMRILGLMDSTIPV